VSLKYSIDKKIFKTSRPPDYCHLDNGNQQRVELKINFLIERLPDYLIGVMGNVEAQPMALEGKVSIKSSIQISYIEVER
jgi:hypothetical protein